jgi:hypothetical protein
MRAVFLIIIVAAMSLLNYPSALALIALTLVLRARWLYRAAPAAAPPRVRDPARQLALDSQCTFAMLVVLNVLVLGATWLWPDWRLIIALALIWLWRARWDVVLRRRALRWREQAAGDAADSARRDAAQHFIGSPQAVEQRRLARHQLHPAVDRLPVVRRQ